MSPRGRRWALAAVLGLAAVELAVGLFVHRPRLDGEAFGALAGALADLPAGTVVLPAEDFLAPHLRAHVPAAAAPDVVGIADLRGVEDLYVVGLVRTWSEGLDALLAGRPRPEAQETLRAGPLRIVRYRFARPERVVVRWTDPDAVRVSANGHPCRRVGARFDCGVAGRVEPRIVEIDFAPRRCLALAVADGTRVAVEAEVRADLLRGHVGFADFNGRLRSDAPVRVSVAVAGENRGTFVATDAEGFRPFEIPLERDDPGTAVSVAIRVDVPAAGTFDADGRYVASPPHLACLEARGIALGAAREGAP